MKRTKAHPLSGILVKALTIAVFAFVVSISHAAESKPQTAKTKAQEPTTAAVKGATKVPAGPSRVLGKIKHPDLVVTSITVVGAATLSSYSVNVPVRVVVKNQGDAPATIFKVAAFYRKDGEWTIFVPFTGPIGSTGGYMFRNTPLPAGGSATFQGNLQLQLSSRGTQVNAWVIADSCSEDVNMPEYCRVLESYETNNKSAEISLTLP